MENQQENFEIKKIPSLANAFDRNGQRLPSSNQILSNLPQPTFQPSLLPIQNGGIGITNPIMANPLMNQYNPLINNNNVGSPANNYPLYQQPKLPNLNAQFNQQYDQLLAQSISKKKVPDQPHNAYNMTNAPNGNYRVTQSQLPPLIKSEMTQSPPDLGEMPQLKHNKRGPKGPRRKREEGEEDSPGSVTEKTDTQQNESSTYSNFKANPQKKVHVHNQYSSFDEVKEHDLAKDQDRPYKCTHPKCAWAFVRESDYRRHIKCHEAPSYQCPYWKIDPSCHRKGGAFTRLDVLKRHLKIIHYVRATKDDKKLNGKEDPGWCIACQTTFNNSKQFLLHTNECSEKLAMKKNEEASNNLLILSSAIDEHEKDNQQNQNKENQEIDNTSSKIGENDRKRRKRT